MKITDVKSPYLFISYAHKDSDTVLPIIRAMEACGFRLWYDQGIEAGTEWPANIAAHLREASAVVVFMSQNTVASRNCRNEINLALEKNIEVLVVYIEDTELRYGLDLQLGTSQSLFYHRYSTLDGFVSVLQTNLILKSCLASNEISAETAVKTKDAVNTAKTPSPDSSRSKKKATITASDDPVLLIGLGGIGSDAVFTAYEMLFPAYRDKLTAIGIDTDPYPSRAFDSAHIFANLMARDYSEDCQPHLFNILLPNPETLELSTLADKLACDEKRELFAHMNTMQKQQTIPPRRLAYLSFCDQTSLKHSVGKIASELSRLAKSSRTTVNVYLVTTLAGRCGTGILLPTAIYLHSLASDYNIRIHITAVLAQTDIIEPFLSPDSVQIARAGAYATLKELCAYGHPDLPWEAYGPFRHIGDRISPRLLIDSIAFVPKAYITDSPSERRSALTDTLIAEVSLQDESILLDKNTNSHQSPDNTCRAHTSAVGKLLFPRSAILHRAATLMASDCTPYTALFRTLDQASSEKQQEARRLRMPFILSEEVYDQMLTEVLEQSHSLPIHLICGIYKDTTRAEAPVIRSLLRDLDQMLQNEIIRMGIPEYIIQLKAEAEAIILPKSHIFNASAARKRCHDAFLSHHSYTRMLLTDCYETYTQFKDRAVDMILADFIPSSTEAFADCGIAPLFRSPDASRYAITEDENAYYAPDVSYALLCLFRQELRTRKKNRHTADIGTLEALLRRNDCQTNARGYYEQCGKDRFLQFDMASTSARTTAIRDLTVLQDDLMYFANTLIDRLTDMLFDQLADGLITRLDSLIRNYRRLFELFPTDRPEMPPLALPPHITSICSQEEIDRIASELYQETVEKAGRIETDEINSIAGGITLSCALNINDKTIRAFPAELVRSLYDACGSYLMRHSERMRSLDKQCVLHALAYLDRNRAPERLRESLARMSPHFFKADKTVLLLPVEDHLFLKNHKTVYNLESPDALQNLVSYPMECQVSPNYRVVPNNLTPLHDPTITVAYLSDSVAVDRFDVLHEFGRKEGAAWYNAYTNILQKAEEGMWMLDPHIFPAFGKPGVLPLIHWEACEWQYQKNAYALFEALLSQRIKMDYQNGTLSSVTRHGTSEKLQQAFQALYGTLDQIETAAYDFTARVQKSEPTRQADEADLDALTKALLMNSTVNTLTARLATTESGDSLNLLLLAYFIDTQRDAGARQFFPDNSLLKAGLILIQKAAEALSRTHQRELLTTAIRFMRYQAEQSPLLNEDGQKAFSQWAHKALS